MGIVGIIAAYPLVTLLFIVAIVIICLKPNRK